MNAPDIDKKEWARAVLAPNPNAQCKKEHMEHLINRLASEKKGTQNR